ncbi:polymorphic toxin type 50 domain-containing protein [Ligilactobacillus faecis]|uniref:Polymorphic toxin type 50 domain-containing protein n=1 Tax=Ligilactobacillus faecis TaxID=762833 RepID=A0ABV4DQL5_9LACO
MNPDKQESHMESTRIEGKSYLYDSEDPQALLDEYSGREIVEVDHIVGIDYNTGEETDWIKIHHSKRRTHIVPFKKQMNGDDEDA